MSTEHDPRVLAAVGGDVEALSTLLREYGPRLREQLSIDKRWQSVLEVDDVLQVTYVEAFLKIKSFTPGGPNAFGGWLRRIAENNLRDAIRSLEAQKRPPPAAARQARDADASITSLLDSIGFIGATPSRDAARGELKTALDAALAALPKDYAAVIRGYDLEARPIEEVAASLGRSPGAIHMLRARAHDRLREIIGPGTNFFTHAG